jgi:hypothetical protein
MLSMAERKATITLRSVVVAFWNPTLTIVVVETRSG